MSLNLLSSVFNTSAFGSVARVNFANFLNFTAPLNTGIGNKLIGSSSANQMANSGMVCSDDGKYMCVTTYNSPVGIGVSQNYGATWTFIAGATGQTAGFDVAISSSGQYMYQILAGSASNQFRYSNDYGSNWTFLTLGTSTTGRLCQCSKNGKYVMLGFNGTAGIWYSNNFGVAGSWKLLGASYPITGPTCGNVSNDGKTVVVTYNNINFVKSTNVLNADGTINDTGATFSTTGIATPDGSAKVSLWFSDDMTKWIASSKVAGYNSSYISINGGVSWTALVTGNASSVQGSFSSFSDDGKYILICYYNGYPYYSTNGGGSFTKISTLPSAGSTVDASKLWNANCFVNRSGTWAMIGNNSDTSTFLNRIFIASNL